MSEEFAFEENDDIFFNLEIPEEKSTDSLQEQSSQYSINCPKSNLSKPISPIISRTSHNITPSDNNHLESAKGQNKKSDKDLLQTKRPSLNDVSQESNKKLRKSTSFLEDCSPIKRIFPGPAGILLDSSYGEENDDLLCTQTTFSVFQDGPWVDMYKDMALGSGTSLPDKYNISWLKNEANHDRFFDHKAPFLAGVIQSLEVIGSQKKTVNVTLRDMTGVIQGMIEHSLYNEYASDLTLGSVIILTNFTVLCCTCNRCDNFHLTITKNNLCSIYNKRKLEIHKVNPQDIILEYCRKLKEHKSNEENAKKIQNIQKPNTLDKSRNSLISGSLPNNAVQENADRFKKCSSGVPIAQCSSSLGCAENNVDNTLLSKNSEPKRYQFRKSEDVRPGGDTKYKTPLIESMVNNKSQNTKISEDKIVNNSQISVKMTKEEEKEIWEKTLEGLDMDSFFGDF